MKTPEFIIETIKYPRAKSIVPKRQNNRMIKREASYRKIREKSLFEFCPMDTIMIQNSKGTDFKSITIPRLGNVDKGKRI
mmetsp:Transcript_31404/g.35886  ORF Transcript_31404/g.35886 Transcript_31404/m.35886 type:complete len:80 (-) Transcript_31404:292-531(-)